MGLFVIRFHLHSNVLIFPSFLYLICPKFPDPLCGPLTFSFCGYQVLLSPEVKQLGCEVDLSPVYSVEVKNAWSCTATPPVRLFGVDRDSFTFTDIRTVVTYCASLCHLTDFGCRAIYTSFKFACPSGWTHHVILLEYVCLGVQHCTRQQSVLWPTS